MLSVLSVLSFFGATARAQPTVRLAMQAGDVPPRLAARVAMAVARAWNVDTAGLVLSWGSGSLQGVPDTAGFRLLGRGEDGWFAVSVEPVNRQARAIRLRVGITIRQLVAVRVLKPGMRLAGSDYREEPHVAWGPPGAEDQTVPEPGWIVRRMIGPGDVLDRFRVAPPPLVMAGQPVRILWTQGNVSVALEGTALNDAVMGGTIRVRTRQHTGMMTGTVTAPGEARIQ
jgi:flagella basal body P-ring formation protein FlgA